MFFLFIVVLLSLLWVVCRPDSPPMASDEALGGPLIPVEKAPGQIMEAPLEDFLIQVLAAEMPAAFHPAALQAQAVAARTYIAAHLPPYGAYRHPQAAVCCDPGHCQAYASLETLQADWGDAYAENWQKIRQAVAATAGQILFYEENVAETPYHSCCGGSTEAAGACWSQALPYLQAHACPYCARSPKLAGSRVLSLEQAAQAVPCGKEDLLHMAAVSHTPGGRIGFLRIGGKNYRGTELRQIWQLPSAAFTWLIQGDHIAFLSLGYGHGVGLCQYGADGMAAAGKTYRQILDFYYPGCRLWQMDGYAQYATEDR
ncbi:MAG: stage II sporulation protein D [Firmicutes bacterium]|nr:stage II sporulation protein D [Bacillota bacterium]